MKKLGLLTKIALFIFVICLFTGCADDEKGEVDNGQRNLTFVISDIHLGDQRSLQAGYGWCNENKDQLIDFLDYLVTHSDSIQALVIAGDMIDEWVAPMDTMTFGDGRGRQLTEPEFFKQVIDANQTVFDKFYELKRKGVELVYIPGNHDMLVTAADFDTYLKGLFTQARDAAGLGRYKPTDEIVIEHGHRYDVFNAPDPLSNKGIDQVTEASILPPGFFVTKLVSTHYNNIYKLTAKKSSLKGEDDFSSFYFLAWTLILNQKPVEAEKYPIVTGIDGYTSSYLWKDYAYVTTPKGLEPGTLYKHLYESSVWKQRCQRNQVYKEVNFLEGLAAGALSDFITLSANLQYLENTSRKERIVVFGHTHEALLQVRKSEVAGKDSVIYANAGTWVDQKWAGDEKKYPNNTFVKIENLNEGGYRVGLFRFFGSSQIDRIASASIQP